VRDISAKHSLRRRIVALAAAYAIALSSLIAGFGAARAEAAAAGSGDPGVILCHHSVGQQPAQAPNQGNNDICTADCCLGCLLLTAALPPPPADAIGVAASASPTVAAPAVAALLGRPETHSHRSRAPPQTA
jgi:hypothetical protein